MRRSLIFGIFLAALLLASGCERRVIHAEEKFFTQWAEENWRRLTPRQKADYYEIIERQKARARAEEEKRKKKGGSLE